jgi:fructosamine-3-kinase
MTNTLDETIKIIFGTGVSITHRKPLSGGCINSVELLTLSNRTKCVLKSNTTPPPGFFAAEAHGLETLRKSEGPRVPKVFKHAERFLLLEHINEGQKTPASIEDCAISLARLHLCKGVKHGLDRDNYLGKTAQPNTRTENGIEFFRRYRLRAFFDKANAKVSLSTTFIDKINRLEDNLSDFMAAPNEEPPSLLHGDLWSGNWLADKKGSAWLIDPATHYGFRESDLAMTELFGGFGRRFYDVYQHHFQLRHGYTRRRPVYQLIHMLNHVALFGRSYLKQTESLLDQCSY